MGYTSDYPNVPEWVDKPEGYQTGAKVKYKGNIFHANFWASEPGKGDPNNNGWRLYDELYDQTPHTPTEQAKIIGYIPTWRRSEGFNYSNAELYQYITHGIIAFIEFDRNNIGEFSEKALNDVNLVISDIVSVGHAVGTKILIALGGATDYGFLFLMERIGNNHSDLILNRTVQKVVDFVNSNNLDGVDLDLECWWADPAIPGTKEQGGRLKSAGPHPAGRGLAKFAQRLKEKMPDKTISAAVFATSWYGNNYDPAMVNDLDWVSIMTYDLTGSWDNTPVGPHTALYKIRNQEKYLNEQQGGWPPARGDGSTGNPMKDNPILSVEDALWYWTNPFFTNWQGEGQNLPRNKILAGVPIYGYDFAKRKDKGTGYITISYKEILDKFPDAHTRPNANIKDSRNIYYETPGTAVEKLNFIKSVGAQGVIIWELSNEVWEENKSIVKALYQNSGNPEKTAPPPFPDPSSFSTNNWMEKLPGHKKLSELNIPGTHETCSLYGGGLVACQDLTLKEQLEAGIRCIDIRCRHIEDTFAIHHDLVFQNLMFGEGVRDVCIDFLKSNPRECIVMLLKPEYDEAENTRSFEDTFDWYIQNYKDFFYLDEFDEGESVPTLDAVRGKIVLLRRFLVERPPKGTNVKWKGDNETFETGNFYIQDAYKVPTTFDISGKWEKVKDHLNRAKSDTNDNKWYINFSSGTGGGAWPSTVAASINLSLYDFLNSESPNRFGTILMDFPNHPTETSEPSRGPMRFGGAPQPPPQRRTPLPDNFLIRKIISLNK